MIKIPHISLLILLCCLFLISACDKENHFTTGDLMVSFGVVEKNTEAPDSSYIIHLDNGDRLIAAIRPIQWIELTDGQRVQVTFSPYDEKINADKQRTFYGRINGIRNIQFKNIIRLSPANIDSLGNDPVTIRESWVSGDSILTIGFNFFTEGSVHLINLAQTAVGNGVNVPIVFELRHNASGDKQKYRSPGIISFNLNPFKISGQHQTDFILRYTDYDGIKRDIPHSISY
ncbi:MAG: NigD-like C-terminal domain-containing protein [Prolixibacteraceae bacterium]